MVPAKAGAAGVVAREEASAEGEIGERAHTDGSHAAQRQKATAAFAKTRVNPFHTTLPMTASALFSRDRRWRKSITLSAIHNIAGVGQRRDQSLQDVPQMDAIGLGQNGAHFLQ